MDDFEIRLAEQKDLPAIEELIKSGNLSTNLEKCRYVLKACFGSEIVGAVGLEFWGDYVSLRALIVDKLLRHHGIGTALIRRAIELARKDGALAIYAYTLFWNNKHFRSWGFERVDKASVPGEIEECVQFHDPHYKYCCAMELKIGTDPVEETIKCYEETAEDYARRRLDPEVMRKQLEFFIENLQGKKVLDVGCGPGRDVKFFTDHGLEAVGIDPAENLLRIAQRVAPEAMFLKMDMRALGFAVRSFDGLWVLASLLHIPKEEVPATLRGFQRILKPGGLLYLSVKEGEGEIWRDYGKGRWSFTTFYRLEELRQLVEEAGFEIIKITLDHKHAVFIDVFARPKQ